MKTIEKERNPFAFTTLIYEINQLFGGFLVCCFLFKELGRGE